MRLKQRLHDLKWWFYHRFHPSHRYHVVHTGLEPGWCDRDMLMAILIQKVVIDFVEKEKPYEWFETETSRQSKDWADLRCLYSYFKEVDIFELSKDDQGYQKLNESLVEAIRLRHLLWT